MASGSREPRPATFASAGNPVYPGGAVPRPNYVGPPTTAFPRAEFELPDTAAREVRKNESKTIL